MMCLIYLKTNHIDFYNKVENTVLYFFILKPKYLKKSMTTDEIITFITYIKLFWGIVFLQEYIK